MCWSIFNTAFTCTLYLYRECYAEAIGEVTKREMKLCLVGGEVSSTMFTESFLTLCGATEHSELLACEGVCGVTVCMLVCEGVSAWYACCNRSERAEVTLEAWVMSLWVGPVLSDQHLQAGQ